MGSDAAIVYFMTHPEVVIDPGKPVPDWPLSLQGIRRMKAALGRPWLNSVGAVFSSAERKATDAAQMVADHCLLSPIIVDDLGENDRSATGYLPQAEFEAVADKFFARPQESICGWERAVDAQRRVVEAVDRIIDMALSDEAAKNRDIVIVSHGGVGALLLCHLKCIPISRVEDQPNSGGGNVYAFRAATRRLISGWCRIED
ncbi:histidine phosphatase family protein [Rhodopila sp.]|uniref:histidine phosphatase family protein n=1 Tax=Rhodopila sp. TaxID=2480087 RepID=UPI003D0D537A